MSQSEAPATTVAEGSAAPAVARWLTPHELTIEFWPGGTSTINVPAGGVSVNVPDDAETMTITDPAPNGANGIDVVVSAS